MVKKTTNEPMVLPKMNVQTIEIPIEGISPLISHRRSEKQSAAILDKQMKKAKQAKEARDPDAEFQDSLYKLPDGGFGIPAIAFKKAAIGACRQVDGISMTLARGAFHVVGEMVKIEGSEPTMRQDWVTIGMGTSDLRFRGEFKDWSCKVIVRFNANVISAEQLVNLFDTAGFACGVGDWRPECDGPYGQFRVARE